ncbi:Putative ribonuclease H protein At1g65750 [Linum perenne]
MKAGGGRGISWMRWERLCVRKEDGGMGFKDLHSFNLAMLDKARYFPRGDFLSTVKKSSSSPIWQSIWATQIETPRDDYLAGLRVCDLLIPGEHEWDVEMVQELFNERDARAIVEIPLHADTGVDSRIWHLDKSGAYTVRSGYQVIMERLVPKPHLVTPGPWLKIWSLDVPPRLRTFLWRAARGVLPTRLALQERHFHVPTECGLCGGEIENAWHVFLNCSVANRCWEVGGFLQFVEEGMQRSESLQEWIFNLVTHTNAARAAEVTAILNSIWRERNNRVWTGKKTPAIAIVRDGLEGLRSWINVKQASNLRPERRLNCWKWHPPPPSVFKCNVDAATFERERRRGVGIAIRGDDGGLKAFQMSSFDGIPTPTECEALALLEAVRWVRQLGLGPTIFEVDSQVVAQAIHAATDDTTELGMIIRAIRNHLLTTWRVNFIKRNGNSVAHVLARQSKHLASTTIGYASPTWLIDALNDSCFACEH